MERSRFRPHLKAAALAMIGAAAFFSAATALSLRPISASLHDIQSGAQSVRVTDRNGQPLAITYQDRWNSFDHIRLYDMPDLLKTAFILSEDRRFYNHHGVDWTARWNAAWQNIRHGQTVRGASTITEQVVRMVNTRPRNLWSRWLEGFEAASLENHSGKADILEFYLNQVPYAANRRGVAQAARYYFDRDLSTLSMKEMLALAVLVRAPSGYDLYRYPGRIDKPVMRLAAAMKEYGALNDMDFQRIHDEVLKPAVSVLPVDARHFGRYVRLSAGVHPGAYETTLDSGLQRQVQAIIDNRLKTLQSKNVHNAAAIIADYRTGEILAWVVGGSGKAGEIDTVTTPRQPGSAMKPFLYARALDKGWTAATMLDDAPLTEAVGNGLHNFRNYSNIYYGPVTLREALGNSLNIPALLTIRHVGAGDYLSLLQTLGFKSLALNSEIYDEGLALGNGEVTLLEMVQAYGALANRGLYQPFHFLRQQNDIPPPRRVYSEETASLIANILSDPAARRLEFGAGSPLNLPTQTAAKTGTSTDYRDAWAMGFNDRYVVGIWTGNLDNTPMQGITGSAGPALSLRGIFALLNKDRDTDPLYISARLTAKDVCIRAPDAEGTCPMRTEWFVPGTVPNQKFASVEKAKGIELVRPTDGLRIAYDPRIPSTHQKFRFEVKGADGADSIEWRVDDMLFAEGPSNTVLWPVQRGQHRVSIAVNANGERRTIQPVTFIVK